METPALPSSEVILSAISLLISFLALFISIIFTRSAKKRSSVEMSISLASDYQKMLDEMWVIKEIVQQHPKITKVLDNLKVDADCDFNNDELVNRLSKEDFKLLEEFFEDGTKLDFKIVNSYYDCEASVMHCGSAACVPSNDALRHYFKRKIISALNKAEYISMAFAHGIAIDGVVYQSLHQSFFNYVNMFYFHIAFMNKKATDHYYTNMITLYRNWKREDNNRRNNMNSILRVKDIDQKNTEKSIRPTKHTKKGNGKG